MKNRGRLLNSKKVSVRFHALITKLLYIVPEFSLESRNKTVVGMTREKRFACFV